MTRNKAIVYGMLFILFTCIVFMFIRVSSPGNLPEITVKKAVQTVDTTRLLKLKDIHLGRLGALYDLVRLEARTRRVLQKERLTRKDSIFLDEVNNKLNRILHEKD